MTPEAGAARLAVLSDLHLGGHGEEPARFLARAQRAIAGVNAARADAVLVAGDLTQQGTAEEFALARTVLSGLAAPFIAVPGNHDVGNKRGAGEAGPTPDAVAQYEGAFGPACGVTPVGAVRVVRLNAPLLGAGGEAEEAQWRCLDAALREGAGSRTVLLLHYPPFLRSADEPDDPYWNLSPAPRVRLMDAVTAAGVRAVVSGHLHREMRHRVGETWLYTAAPVSFGLPPGAGQTGWSLLTVSPRGVPGWRFHPAGPA